MLISSTEPIPIRDLGTTSALPERYGADILIIGNKLRFGVQRKQFPSDLLGSLADGRLYEQMHQMLALDRTLLIVEGYGKWTTNDELVDIRLFTKKQMYGLFFSLAFEFGIEVLQVRDMQETINLLTHLEVWAQKEKHDSLRTRRSAPKSGWGKRGNREYGCFLLQSFPGIGPELAGRIYDHFGKAPISWEVTEDDLRRVPGVGKGKAKGIWHTLNGEETSGSGS